MFRRTVAFAAYILNGMYSLFGSSCDFNYPQSGTRVEMVVTPIVAGTPYSSKKQKESFIRFPRGFEAWPTPTRVSDETNAPLSYYAIL